MNEKINQLLNQYNATLERKLSLIKPYEIKNNDISLDADDWNIKEREEYSRLKAEIKILKEHIEDLKWITE